MGILNFLKKEKKKDDYLDLPPPPPSLEHTDLPEFPELDENKNLDFSKGMEDLKMPEFESPHFEETPAIDIPPMKASDGYDFEDGMEQEPAIQEDYKGEEASPDIGPKESQVHYGNGVFYARVDDFRLILGEIGSIKSELRKAEEGFVKLEGMKLAKDRSFDKIKGSLEDIQKKLIFVDKTLFKGE